MAIAGKPGVTGEKRYLDTGIQATDSEPGKMRILEYEVKFLTPAFLGNASQGGQWRTPPFKALLRQWWRVVWATRNGYPDSINGMRSEEGRLFGNAWLEEGSCRSAVMLRLDSWSDGKLKKQQWSESPDPLLYAGYGLLKNARETAICCEQSGALQLAAPDWAMDDIKQTIALIHRYGTIGGRRSNGWGSIEIKDAEPALCPGISRPWEEALKLEWPHAIGEDDKGPLVWETKEPVRNWKKLMGKFGSTRKEIRQIIKAPKGNERLPNTIRFKARRADDMSLKGVVFHMPCKPPCKPPWNVKSSVLDCSWLRIHEQLDEKFLRRGLGHD